MQKQSKGLTMVKFLYIFIMITLGSVTLLSQSNEQSTLKETVISGVVFIKPNPDDDEIGAGFLVNSDGYIFTNFHVISSADLISNIHIEFNNGVSAVLEKVIYQDSINDIAIIKIDASYTKDRTVLPLNTIEGIVGEDVVTFGHPLGFKFNMTKGVISNMAIEGEPQRFLFDAPTNPGNSGGPLMNKFGLVVGMVEGRYDSKSAGIDVQNLNTGIKASYLISSLDKFGIKYNTTALLEDKELLERKKMQMGQDSIKQTQAIQDIAVKETQRKQDSIQAHLDNQKKALDSSKAVQDEMIKMIVQERIERKRFEDSLRSANKPLPWVAKISVNYGYDLGAFKDMEDNDGLKQGGTFKDIGFMLGYRSNIEKNDDKGTIVGLFLAAGSLAKYAANIHYFNQKLNEKTPYDFEHKYDIPTQSSMFFEGEAGLIIGESLRISAGIGAIDIWGEYFSYYTLTAGLNFPLGALSIDMLLSSMFGQDFKNPTLRAKVGLGYRICF